MKKILLTLVLTFAGLSAGAQNFYYYENEDGTLTNDPKLRWQLLGRHDRAIIKCTLSYFFHTIGDFYLAQQFTAVKCNLADRRNVLAEIDFLQQITAQ